jgi:hypothetical protein
VAPRSASQPIWATVSGRGLFSRRKLIQIKAGTFDSCVHMSFVKTIHHARPQPTWRAPMDDEIRRKILTLLDQHRIMTIATLRPDGWPQATTVGYVNEGLTLYFLCGLESQKAANLVRDDRVSLTIDHDTPQVMEITGLSMAAHAQAVVEPAEADKVLRMLPLKYPKQVSLPGPMPAADQVRIFRVTPAVISVLDYSKGFGHTDLVTCSAVPAGFRCPPSVERRYPSKLGSVGEEVSI